MVRGKERRGRQHGSADSGATSVLRSRYRGGFIPQQQFDKDDDTLIVLKFAIIEVAQQPLGARLGTIDADNAEVLEADLLDPRVDDAARLLQDLEPAGRRTFTAAYDGHCDCLLREGLG